MLIQAGLYDCPKIKIGGISKLEQLFVLHAEHNNQIMGSIDIINPIILNPECKLYYGIQEYLD